MTLTDLLAFPGMNFAATTDALGGSAPAGGEPDIFDGVDVGGDGGGDDNRVEAPVQPEGGTEGDGSLPEDAGAEPGASEEGAEVSEQPTAEGVEPPPPVEEPAKPPAAVAAPPKPAPRPALTEEDKKVEATLQEAYHDTPKLKEALKAYPELRSTFFKAASINKVFPTVQDADRAKQWALDLYHLDQKFYADDKREFLNTLWNECLDKEGKSTGHFEKVAEVVSSDVINSLSAQIAQNPQSFVEALAKYNLNEKQLSTAVEITKLLIAHITGQSWQTSDAGLSAGGARPVVAATSAAIPPTPAGQEPWTPRERALHQRLQAAESKNAVEAKTSAEQVTQVFNKQIFDNFFSDFQEGLTKRLSASIPATVRENPILLQWFGEAALKRVHEAMRADELFDATVASAAKSGDRGPQHVQAIADMMKQRAQLLMPGVVRQLASELAAKRAASAGQGQGAARIAGQNGPRREPATGGAPSRLTRPVGKGSQPPARPSGRAPQEPLKSQGDYNRFAEELLNREGE